MIDRNQIPPSWEIVKLGEVCEIVTGTTPSKSDSSNYGNDIPFIKPPQLIDRPIFDTDEKLSYKGAKKARVIPPNTVLVTCIGNLGRTGIVKIESAFNQQLNAVLENDVIAGKYIFYQAQSPYFKRQLENLSSATTVAIVNKGKFSTIEIPLPPLLEQHRIVSKIEELFSELDKGIESLKTAQQQLKIYRQAVLKWAFEGRLTHENVKDGELPEGWKWVKISEIGKVKGGKRLPKGEMYSEEKTNFPYLRVTDFENLSINQSKLKYLKASTQDKIKNYTISINDVFISIAGTIGITGTIPENLNGSNLTENAAKITELKNIDNRFLALYLSSEFAQTQIKSHTIATTQPKLSLFRIEKIDVPLPQISEQQQIVQEIETRLSVCDKLEETISQSLQQAETLRQSILKKAFEGKLIKE